MGNGISKGSEGFIVGTMKTSIATLNPFIAFLLALPCGVASLYCVSTLIPIFLGMAKLINTGTPMNQTAWEVVILLAIYGCAAYMFTIAFQLLHRRVIESLYMK